MDLSVKLDGLSLINPIIAASGTFGYGLEYSSLVDLNALGGFSTKGLSLQPRMQRKPCQPASSFLATLNVRGVSLMMLKRVTQNETIYCYIGRAVWYLEHIIVRGGS